MKKEVSYKIVSLVFSVLVICFLAAFYVLGWTEPTAVPPGGNVPAPINVGSEAQSKLGDLNIGSGLKYWITKIGDSFALKNDPTYSDTTPGVSDTTFIIGQDGKVGIGTPSPDKLVHLYNNAGGAGIGLKIQNAGGDSAAELYLQNDARTYTVGIRTDDKFTVFDNTAGSSRLIIDTNGNVGIGTPNPQVKLDVDGLTRTGRYSLDGSTGSTPPAASANNKGAIFYNTDNDIMYYSNGSSWQPMGGGALFGAWTNKDSLNNTLVKDKVYRVSSDGFVVAYRYQNDSVITFYTDSSNPPTTMRGETWGDNAQGTGVIFPVRKGDYWKLTGSDLTATYWLPIGSGQSQAQ